MFGQVLGTNGEIPFAYIRKSIDISSQKSIKLLLALSICLGNTSQPRDELWYNAVL